MPNKLFKRICLISFFCVLLCSQASLVNVFARDIVIYGDSQHDADVQRRIVNAIILLKPLAVFRVGDLVEDGNDPLQWKLFREITEPLLTTTQYYPVLGNHERESELYFVNFPQINHQHWYSVESEGIHFIILDSNLSLKPGSEQYNWLVSNLKGVKEGVKFKIVLFHHPIFSVGMHPEDEMGLRSILLPLFQKYGVSVVFSGHEHAYERLEYQGIYFIVTGGGGSALRGQSRDRWYLQKFKKVYHFCLLSLGNDLLRVRAIDIDSEVIDDFNIAAPVLR